MHNLMHSLVRNAKPARKINLRDASSVSSTDGDIPFAGREGQIRRRGDSIQLGEQIFHGGMDRSPGRTVLGPNSPLYDKDKPDDGF